MRGSDRGTASVVLATVLVLAVALCAAVFAIGRIAAARVRASTAADLAALAAAVDTSCARAPRVALDNGAELLGCRVDGTDVVVHVRVAVQVSGKRLFVTALSRAGPP